MTVSITMAAMAARTRGLVACHDVWSDTRGPCSADISLVFRRSSDCSFLLVCCMRSVKAEPPPGRDAQMRLRVDSRIGRVLIWPIAARSRDDERHEVSQVNQARGHLVFYGAGRPFCPQMLGPAASQFTNRDDLYLVPRCANSATGSDRSQTW